eukprot:2446684-Pyramimonas_sp.AAC.1
MVFEGLRRSRFPRFPALPHGLARRPFRSLQDGPRGPEEGPKTAQEAPRTAQLCPKGSPREGPEGTANRYFE